MLPTAATPSSLPPLPGLPYPGMPFAPEGSGRPQVPPAMQSTFDPWALLQALQRRWLLASFLGILATVGTVVGAYWYFWQPQRKVASAYVFISPVQPYLLIPPREESENAIRDRLLEEVDLARSAEVVLDALQDPELEKLEDFASQGEDWRVNWLLSGRYNVASNEKTNTIQLYVVSSDNERWLVPVVNALQRAFVKRSEQREMEQRQARYDARYQLWHQYGGKIQLEINERKEQEHRLQLAHPGALDNRKVLREQLKNLEEERRKLVGEMYTLEIERATERAELGETTVAAEEIQAELDLDEDYLDYLEKRRDLTKNIEAGKVALRGGLDNPHVKEWLAELRQLDKDLEEYQMTREQEIRETLTAKKEAVIQEALKDFGKKLKNKQQILDSYVRKITEATTELSRLPETTVDTSDLEAALEPMKPLMNQLQDELDKMEKERTAPARVMAKPEAVEPPQVEEVPPPYRKIAFAGLAALGVVLTGVSLLEYRTRRIHTANEVVQGLGLRLLGTIPTWSPSVQQASGYGNTLAYNLWTESVDTARTMVTHAAQAESARVVMVTSATSGEGKTSLASHLASSLARAGHRTLLIDGDLRSPAIHALFDQGLAPGLCEVLRGQLPLDQALRATPARDLFLLTAGQWDSNALQGLAQGSARELFTRLKEQFDYVIVDSSPVLAVADALMIGRHVDGVLLSILRDVSRVPTVYAAYQRLSMLGIRTLGAVVNGARTERYGSWYNAAPSAA